MNKENWERAKELFDRAQQLSPDDRKTFLAHECTDDPNLADEVQRLLGFYDSEFLESPALSEPTPLLDDERFSPGQMIGRYRIRELIGTGGMGRVFLADDSELSRPVAVKVLHSDVAENDERVRRFIQEARAASALNHPNILTIYEIGSFEGSRFIVSEYIDGETLRDRMRDGLTVGQSLDITTQVAAALKAAHAAGIVHRDIKPENVMIRADGLVKVLDFGLAKLTEADDLPIDLNAAVASRLQTSPGLIMGTVAYMSPEQARGQIVDARTDLWSLGVVLHEMLTGEPPFKGESVTDLVTSILKHDAITIDEKAIPTELRPICTKALAKDRKARYQSAQHLLQDLQGEKKKMEYAIQSTAFVNVPRGDDLKTQLIRPRPTLSAEYLFTEIKRHKYATVGTLTAALLVATALLVYTYKGATPSAHRDSARPVITLSTTEKDLKISRLPTSGKVYDIAISSDGKYVAYVSGETDQKNPIRLRQRDTSNEVELVAAPEQGKLNGLSFSPDGKYLYYHRVPVPGVSPRGIDRVPVAGGASAKVINDSDGGVSFSPDGRYVAFPRDLGFFANSDPRFENAEELLIADADGSHERILLHTPYPSGAGAVTQETSWVEGAGTPWSPNGKKIACAKRYKIPDGDGYYKLIAVNVSDGSQEELSDNKWWDIKGAVWLADGNLVIVSKESSADLYQLWLISRDNPPKQITNDLLGYEDLTATKNGDVLAAVQSGARFDLWLAPQYDASRARQITWSGALGAGIDWMPDGRIVFGSRASGDVDLWSMKPDGTGWKQLTSGSASNVWPVSSPDGRYIVFESNRISRFNYHIFRIDADGGNVKQLTNGLREWSPKISPDSKWVYYVQVSDQAGTLCKVSIDGGQPIVLARDPEAPGGINLVDVSRDGRVVFEKVHGVVDHLERTLYVIPQGGGKPVKLLTLPPTASEWGKTWWRFTPDGKSFAFKDTRNGAANIWTIAADGKGKEKQLTNFSPGSFAGRFVWSPDGKQFLMLRGNLTSDGILISSINQ